MASLKSVAVKEAGECRKNSKGASSVRKKKNKKNEREGFEFVAPDGGWGWVVVMACGISNFSTLPLGQNFGLVYKEKFEEWGITQAEYSFMRNLEFSILSCTGLISGALLRKYGFRRMSLIGGSLYVLAGLITSQVKTITHFTIFFSLIGGISTGIGWPSNALALNTYFKLRRGIATGFSWTATGLSPVLMPQLISVLMEYTDVHGTVLILAGIALHSIPAALLLQPVHWHYKWVEPESKNAEKGEPDKTQEHQPFLEVPSDEEHQDNTKCRRASLRRGQVEGVDEDGDYIVDTQSTLGLDVTAPISRHSSRWSLGSGGYHRHHAGHHCEDCETIGEEGAPVIPVTEEGGSISVVEKEPPITIKSLELKEGNDSERSREEEVLTSPKPIWKRAVGAIVDFFDLTILKDPKFLVIFVGMTLAFAAEVNFAVFVPFVYAEFGYEKSRVAFFMTILALMDLVTRFTIPFVTDKIKVDPKISYSVGLTILATGRIVLAHAKDFNVILAASLWLGFGKGIRTVYMALVIPSYVPLHRLPTASGLQMLANGVVFMTIGPIFGYLRDSTGDYTLLLHCINVMTFTAVGLWMMELLVTSCIGRYFNNRNKMTPDFILCERVEKVK